MRPPWLGTIAGVVAALAIGVSTAPTASGADAWPESPAVRSLHEKAKLEGRVVVWGSDSDGLDWIAAPFARRFPGIAVEWAADRGATTKLIAEYRAGRHAVDALIWSLGGLPPLEERGMLATLDWSVWGVDPEDVFFGGAAAATHNLVYAVVYNRERIKEAELPKTWEGFLAPRFRGQLLTSEFLMPRFLAFLALAWGEARALEYLRALRDQGHILVVSGNAPREVMLTAGERVISLPDFPTNATNWQRQGMPLAWVPVSPTGAGQFVSAALLKAPHPSAARLLAGWLATDEAKALLEERRAMADLRPRSRSKLAAELRGRGLQVIYEDVSNMKQRTELYTRFAPFVTGQQR